MADILRSLDGLSDLQCDQEPEIPHERWRDHLNLVLGAYVRKYVANVDATNLMVENMEQVRVHHH